MPGPLFRGRRDDREDSQPAASLTYEEARTGKRYELHVTGRDSRALDSNVVSAIGNIRAGGHRIVRTEMTIGPDEWSYEYDSTGQVERIFKNGEVTP